MFLSQSLYKNEAITNHCFTVCEEKASSGDHEPEDETVLNFSLVIVHYPIRGSVGTTKKSSNILYYEYK